MSTMVYQVSGELEAFDVALTLDINEVLTTDYVICPRLIWILLMMIVWLCGCFIGY